jgi:hypothetical protein
MKRAISISFWLVGSLIAAVVANFALVCLVAGTDLILGQPPQLMGPLFALIVSSGALVLVCRSSARATQTASDEFETRAGSSRNRRRLKSAPRVPAYQSMTVIRRQPVEAVSVEVERVM